MAKKLQVFVSSTYNDLKAERQAVVEAILLAEHIPAGMELFAAGDKSQLETIKQWIQDSDVFMLILGGRYGSIDEESGKSYIQLEYEHAIANNKPFFAAIIDDNYLKQKARENPELDCYEQVNKKHYGEFKENVKSRICRFFVNADQLKLHVLESLHRIEKRPDLVGWFRADAVTDPKPLTAQLGQLQHENQALREKLGQAELASRKTDGGVEVDVPDLCSRLDKIEIANVPHEFFHQAAVENILDGNRLTALRLFWAFRKKLATGMMRYNDKWVGWVASKIVEECAVYGLVQYEADYVTLTPDGISFLRRLVCADQLRSQLSLPD